MTDLHTLESQRRDVAASLKLVERKRDELAATLKELDAQIEAARWEALSEEYGMELRAGMEVPLTKGMINSINRMQGVPVTKERWPDMRPGTLYYLFGVDLHRKEIAISLSLTQHIGWYLPIIDVVHARKYWLVTQQESTHE